MDWILVLATLLFVLVLYFRFLRHDPRYPPCPSTPLPIIGHLLVLEQDSRAQFKKWRQQIGDLFSVYMGRQLFVVVSGYDNIKEVFLKRAEDTLDRPPMFIDEATGIPTKGVFFNSGSPWKEQRSVTLSILKNFGMGKNLLAEKIQEECQCYMDVLAGLEGRPTNLKIVTYLSSSNIICSVVIGRRFDYDDEDIQSMMETLDLIVQDLTVSNIVAFIPVLKYVPGDPFKAKRLVSSTKKIMDLIKKFLQMGAKHDDTFVSAYNREQERRLQAGENTTMDEDNLSKIIFDLFNAGTETAATTILWSILYALNYPEVQEKIHNEIEREIGTERLPSMQDKPKLVYLNAFIMETQRLANVAALSLPRLCDADITIGNYTIPKGSIIISNMDTVAHDEKIWGDNADALVPERFIDENGKLKIREELTPFGIGKRMCPGEGWAKTMLFLYLSTMFQRFRFLPPNPGSPPPIAYVFGADVCPLPYEVRVVDRRTDNGEHTLAEC